MQPLIQEVRSDIAAAQVSGETMPADKTIAADLKTAQSSKRGKPLRHGLRQGFLNEPTKPKSILKKVEPAPATAKPGDSSRPHVSYMLAKKSSPTAAERRAFSGVVMERSGSAATSHVSQESQKVCPPPISMNLGIKLEAHVKATEGL